MFIGNITISVNALSVYRYVTSALVPHPRSCIPHGTPFQRNPSLLTKTEEIELGRKVQELLRWERVRAFLEVRRHDFGVMVCWLNTGLCFSVYGRSFIFLCFILHGRDHHHHMTAAPPLVLSYGSTHMASELNSCLEKELPSCFGLWLLYYKTSAVCSVQQQYQPESGLSFVYVCHPFCFAYCCFSP